MIPDTVFEPVCTSTEAAIRAIRLMDLTSLNDDDQDARIIALCHQAQTPVGNTAAVCIYPRFVGLAKLTLAAQGTPEVKVATVVNFPRGDDELEAVLAETRAALLAGADEIDLVIPWRALKAGDEAPARAMVRGCKALCGKRLLKVIIESGELQEPALVRAASLLAIEEGADFIKTSTGKVPVNATPEACRIMLAAIAECGVQDQVGFKAAGGVKSAQDAAEYLAMAAAHFGDEWLVAEHFRFGASSLLGQLLATIEGKKPVAADGSY
ncbi:deoxyribose-phosphate aldolase [Aeromonas veronii]|uniref:deoxyribose-phosphate aldolase n=1 Tax=Aeromonas veronii TaxID=654 RepID=UPI00214DF072|nr:deoxyribose-phosphate aldolase [Aeromonas veronii]MCR3971937.1 deoxyribose-phosphate aldolase [Aeromonas veronii]MCR3976161.1 deoxyribose-phosphate aldolase [Aeromonas veronii]